MARWALPLAAWILARGAALPVGISGRQIVVNGKSLFLKGVNWNPVPKGGQQGYGGVHFRGFAETDSELMAAAGINAVRTYEPIVDVEVLDILWQKGIHVLNTVYISGDTDPSVVMKTVAALKDHPAILMWVIGNEWNYNMLYSGMNLDAVLARVRKVARLIKDVDKDHLVATVYGMVPTAMQVQALPEVDVWGLTVYTGLSFGNTFDLWASRTEKPMFLAEFGADAFNARTGEIDEASQARATSDLTQQVIGHSAGSGGSCVGGFIFELADEWWKDGKGSPAAHDAGGIAPGGGPFPDNTFNEEYWGIVRIDGTPRQAYFAYARVVVPGAPLVPLTLLSRITGGIRLKACGANPNCVGELGDCCPGRSGVFNRCCSQESRVAHGEQHAQPKEQSKEQSPSARPADEHMKNDGRGNASVVEPPWMPRAHSAQRAEAPPSKCALDAAVPCCPDRDCGSCAGNQCCPSEQGSVTCPSASKALADGCIHPKLYDCTGITGIRAPSTTTTVLVGAPHTTTTVAPASTATSTTWQAPAVHRMTTSIGPGSSTTKIKWRTQKVDIHRPAPDDKSEAIFHFRESPDHSWTNTRTTSIYELSVHTTMAQSSRKPAIWVLGEASASCETACKRLGGCVEGGWPGGTAEFMRIANDLGYSCFDLQPGGGLYDPSSQQGNCGWRGPRGAWRPSGGAGVASRCAAQPPASTRRFCPCRDKSHESHSRKTEDSKGPNDRSRSIFA